MENMDAQNRVQWVYSSRDNKELAERYDEWAKDYDSDLEKDFGWEAPKYVAQVFSRFVPKESTVLDAGSGTGLVGFFLNELGYINLIAMDMSEGMLKQAQAKNVYQEFHQMVMGEKLGFDTDCFDAVVSVGVMTVGHAPASSLDELVRVTKSGGHIIFTLRPDVYENDGFKQKLEAFESEGKWTLVEKSEEFQPLPKGEPEVYHRVWIFQVN